MKRIAQLLLAVGVLISQMGMSSLVCACPEPSAPAARAVEKSAVLCPMSGESNCRCCIGSQTSVNQSVPSATVNSKSAGCVAKVVQAPCTKQGFTSTEVLPLMDLPVGTTVLMPVSIQPVPLDPVHLVVPRVRPPDASVHGLRAPPLS